MDQFICAHCGHPDTDHMFYRENCVRGTRLHSPEDKPCDCPRFIESIK